MSSEKGNSGGAPGLNLEVDLGLACSFRTFSKISSGVVSLVGASVLLGWALDSAFLISLAPRLVAMNPITAAAFVLAAASLWLLVAPAAGFPGKLFRRRLAQACAFGVLVAGLLRLSEILFGWPLGVDQILFVEKLASAPGGWPNRMAPNTAFNFLLVGSALLLLDVESRRGRGPAQFLVLGSALVAFLALMGYAYGAPIFHRLPLFIPMALNTAVAFLVLSLGVLCARPDRGVMAAVTTDSAGGRLARWLLPAAVAVPVLLGWLRWQGQEAGLYAPAVGITLYTSTTVVILVLLVWRSAFHLGRADLERRRAAEEIKGLNEDLQRRTDELDRFFTLSLDMLCIAGFDGYFKRLNPAWEGTLGFSNEELLAQPYLEFVHPDDQERTAAEAEKLSEGETVSSFENRYRCRDGSYRWLLWTAAPLVGKQLVYAAARDVTPQKEVDERIRHINAELAARSAELMLVNQELKGANQELEAFTYSVSHDLRAPLRHIDGFSRLLLEEHSQALPAPARHYLERVRQGTRQMGHLVDDLLNLARVGRQELKQQVTGLASLVEEARRGLLPEQEGRQVEWRVGALPFVECDPTLLKQVFANLLSNALKYTRPRKPAVIEVGQAQVNGQPAVFVRDNGVGFSMKYADKLFGVFQRLHRPEDFEGTGVGLATVQRIIRKHGGRVWAEATLDQGATFYFTLGTRESNEAGTIAATTTGG